MSRSIPRGKIRVYVCARCMMGGGTLRKKPDGYYVHGSGTGCAAKGAPPLPQVRGR